MNFGVFSQVTRKCEKVGPKIVHFTNERHFETCSPKMKKNTFFEKKII